VENLRTGQALGFDNVQALVIICPLMNISATHQRNALGGWDIVITISGGPNEITAAVRIELNDFSLYNQRLDPPSNQWIKEFLQKGDYPGLNRLVVTATDTNDKDYVYTEEWGA
jgi:hypothetical protein